MMKILPIKSGRGEGTNEQCNSKAEEELFMPQQESHTCGCCIYGVKEGIVRSGLQDQTNCCHVVVFIMTRRILEFRIAI